MNYRIKPELKPDVTISTCISVKHIVDIHVNRNGEQNLKLTFDGETGKLKKAELL